MPELILELCLRGLQPAQLFNQVALSLLELLCDAVLCSVERVLDILVVSDRVRKFTVVAFERVNLHEHAILLLCKLRDSLVGIFSSFSDRLFSLQNLSRHFLSFAASNTLRLSILSLFFVVALFNNLFELLLGGDKGHLCLFEVVKLIKESLI